MPYFVLLHAGMSAGLSSISMSPAAATSYPLHATIDGRAQSLARHGSSSSSAYWQVDRGAGTLEAVDLLWIPSGHNLGSQTVTVKASATGAFAGEETTLASFTSAAGQIEQTLTSSTARYVRVGFGGSGTWEYGELWLGRKRTPSVAHLTPSWAWPKRANVETVSLPSGVIAATIRGPDLQAGSLEFRWAAGDDLTLFRDMQSIAGGGKRPILVGAPDDAMPTIVAFVANDVEPFAQDSSIPQGTGPTYTVKVELVEAIG